MKLSIIIPAYNEEACLALLVERLDACMASTFTDHEVEVLFVEG